jgi:hypothetical protein
MRASSALVLPIFLIAACMSAAADKQEALLNTPVLGLTMTSTTTTAILDVVESTRRQPTLPGLFGFHRVHGAEANVTLMNNSSTVSDALREIVRQDSRYMVVPTASPYVIDILATDPHAPGEEVLAFRMPRIDIEKDDWPENLIGDLPNFSPELSKYLAVIYGEMGATNRNEGIASSATVSNPTPPHFSLHLRDVSVLEALNQITAHSFEQYSSVEQHFDVVGVDGVRRKVPAQKNFHPTGWIFELVPPGDLAYPVWLQQLFKPL